MILVTGGAGYIGSHTVVELINKGYEVLIADNFSNSSKDVITRIEKITGKKISFIEVDLCDYSSVKKLCSQFKITGVIHFAAYKAVGESVELPLKYYHNNIASLVSVLKLCEEQKISNFVFSSSCTVYGNPTSIPVTEDSPIKSGESPYGKSKIFSEEIIADFQKSNPISCCNLRYFNPIGAHPSGLIGDLPSGTPNNLLPYVTQVAAGLRKELLIFGNDYNTKDGSCVRDFIHVLDLAKAHISALQYNDTNKNKLSQFNIGTGEGVSVLELIKTFEKVNQINVPFKIVDRRPGDVEAIYAVCSKAKQELKWAASLNLEDMLVSSWKFQKNLSNE